MTPMAPSEESSEHDLAYRAVLPGARGRVFRAWTSPAEVEAWFAPPPNKAKVVKLDARPGGLFRLEMREPSGEVHAAVGRYVTIQPPDRLAFTWAWEVDGVVGPEGLVTIEFRDRGHETEVVLTHAHLPGSAEVLRHLDGWKGCIASLEAHLSRAA